MTMTSTVDEPAKPAWPACKCGTNRTSRYAVPERDYTLGGVLYALWGGTAVPSRVSFRCLHCSEVFERARDRATRYAFII